MVTGSIALLGALIIFGMVFAARASASTILSVSDISKLAKNAGFMGDDLVTAVAISLAETNPTGNPRSLGDNGDSKGLWQIDTKYHPEFNGWDLFDPQTNALAAFSVYQAADHDFTPWSTYNSGKYQTFIEQAQGAISA